MGITDTSSRVTFSGDGSTTDFDFDFRVFDQTQIRVILRDSDGAETTQTLTTDYTVDLNTGEGGTVTMGTAPASGETLYIGKNVPETQPDSITVGNLPAATLEQMSDRLTMLIHQLREEIRRVPKFSRTTPNLDKTLPEPIEGNFLQWDASGNLVNATTFSSGVSTAITSSMSATNITGYSFTPGQWVRIEYFVTRNSASILGSGTFFLLYNGAAWVVAEGSYISAPTTAFSSGLTFSMAGNQLRVAADASGDGTLITKFFLE